MKTFREIASLILAFALAFVLGIWLPWLAIKWILHHWETVGGWIISGVFYFVLAAFIFGIGSEIFKK